MVYFVVIFVILGLYFSLPNIIKNENKRKRCFIAVSFTLIYLLFVFRDVSVGRDIPGYYKIYNQTANVPFNDFSYVYFENGYILLMKICNQLHLSFNGFFAVAYAIAFVPLAIFIYKHSSHPLLSIIVFVCYMYMDFYLTGLRQSLAMSIVLIGILFLLHSKSNLKGIVLFYLFMIVAFFFHKSAIITLFVPLLKMIKKPLRFVCILVPSSILLLAFRSSIFQLIKNLFDKETMSVSAGLYIGPNLIILFLISVIYLLLFYCNKRYFNKQTKHLMKDELFFIGMFLISILVALFFGTETSARSFMFYNISILIILPNLLTFFDKKTSQVICCSFVVFFICYFAFQLFSGGTFDIYPYKFFFE